MTDSSSLPQPPTAQPPESPVFDKDFYTWTTFFSLLAGQRPAEDRAKYMRMRDLANEEADCKKCEKHLTYLFNYSPVVRFMRDEIKKLGTDVNPTNVRCKRCTTRQTGGFDLHYGILLCANELQTRGQIEDTVTHEMVHLYDNLRFKFNDLDLKHHACTEIRASTLSGECRFAREFFKRGQTTITQQLQECVRRRATLSMRNRSSVRDDVHAAQLVNEVWDSCFNDTRPFDEIYR
ncbi:mitochondrial inner membrane protease Atp23 [Aulographum hederae CBS 113979]|uniref:Mitochondrial inner membrane protease ATP23 n=1 Tax=Aulographum hederae CBS 113979 TaxID=1176131 RepID=A0A6G1GPK4_9PEZI|nr:mitochondrial inner membrane protease Atp23 [Aulographum hederae CBS 113979]